MSTTYRSRLWPWAFTVAALTTWAVLATTTAPAPGGFRVLTGPEWRSVVADPGAHAGARIVVFGVVTQPGAGTRRDVVRAAVDGLDRSDPAGYRTAAVLRGADPVLVAGDTFRAEVTVAAPGPGGPALDVHRIRVLDGTG